MYPKKRDLLERLPAGPAFLILGQASDSMGGDRPRLLAQAAAMAALEVPGYDALARTTPPERRRLYQALAAVSLDSAVPDWLEEVARYPWNGVLTTRVDAEVARAFDNEWRRVVPSAAPSPSRHPRSSSELRVWMLFGGAALPEEEQPPADNFEFVTRRRAAAELVQRLPDTLVTPRGTLLIDGYALGDWLATDDVFAFVSSFLPGQAHLFSAGPELLADEYVAAAVERGLLSAHPESLALVLSEAEEAGRLRRPAATRTAEARMTRLGGQSVPVGRDLWNATVTTARPVDTSLLVAYGPASPAVAYQRFRDFLGSTEGAPPWTPIASSMNFRRGFEEELGRRVSSDLAAGTVPSPLIVEGQAATGKSTALCALAVETARAGNAAVLHVARRGDRPAFAAIDSYALWAEEHGATSTLLIWDGMADTDEYFSAHRFFRARGRRVLIVGTTYRPPVRTSRTITAPPDLSTDELSDLERWLAWYGIAVTASDRKTDSSFLATIYRLLPESRRGVERGLTLELRTAEVEMHQTAQERNGALPVRSGAMADALFRAGIRLEVMSASARPDADLLDLAFAERSTSEQLTTLVLVAGRRGLRIPLELVLRVLGRDGSLALIEVIKTFDIVRWSEDEAGEQYLGARTALEAEILARNGLADAFAEVEVITMFIRELRISSSPGGGPEVQFLVDLFARIGPQSGSTTRYVAHYPKLTEALRELRLRTGHPHPRLVLLEANLTREFVMRAQRQDDVPAAERLAMLRDVQDVLEDVLIESGVTGRARLNLLVELASSLGAESYELSSGGEDSDSAALQDLTDRVVSAALEARAIDPESYYPVDVVGWVTQRAVSQSAVEPSQRANLISSALASFESVNRDDLSPSQQAKYDGRYAKLAELAHNPALAREHLDRLAANDDPAAYYLLALRESSLQGLSWDSDGAASALARLMAAPAAVQRDWRCARLMFDLFWLTRTGDRFMRGERQALAFTNTDWEQALDLLAVTDGARGFDAYRADFLRGLALFHLGRLRAAIDAFDELNRSAASVSTRIVAAYVASTPDGEPRKFTGQVRSATPDARRGRAWIDQLGIELPFTPYRFPGEALQQGDLMPEFHVVFNLRGPYLDPVRASGVRGAKPDGRVAR